MVLGISQVTLQAFTLKTTFLISASLRTSSRNLTLVDVWKGQKVRDYGLIKDSRMEEREREFGERRPEHFILPSQVPLSLSLNPDLQSQ
jgi:hypothetical protein